MHEVVDSSAATFMTAYLKFLTNTIRSSFMAESKVEIADWPAWDVPESPSLCSRGLVLCPGSSRNPTFVPIP